MQVDLMQRFPMGIVGFSAASRDRRPIGDGVLPRVPSRLMAAWRLAVDLATVARTRALLGRSPATDHPRRIDLVIDYFGERRPIRGSGRGVAARRGSHDVRSARA